MSIVAEAPGFMQVFSDGSVKRFPLPISDASPEFSSNGYKTKDVIIDPTKPVTARIFFPDATEDRTGPLPVLVYFHGGAFCIASTTWTGYDHFLGGLCNKAQCIIISVDYRLAPEHRLPAAYDDCFGSLDWLTRCGARSEPWLERADLSRVFLSGDASGGNIAHHVIIKTATNSGSIKLGVEIKGVLMMDPFFGSERRTESEMADGNAGMVELSDMLWRLSLPEGSDRDHFASNFEATEPLQPEIEWTRFPPVIVFAAGLDMLKERGVMYVEFLRNKGVKKVELMVTQGEYHGYYMYHPDSESTHLLQDKMTQFMTHL